MKWFSSSKGLMRVVVFESPDEKSFDSGLENFKAKAPDLLGYAAAKVKIVKTGTTTGVLIVETKNKEALETYMNMLAPLREEMVEKFGMKLDPHSGEVIWSN